ncbi:MAG TPA: methylmalonyl Co-A mutase-associated GTPase MeaB [Acidimicrobiales bacterium]|nr:methylmalonyl Co-A mutase-associated GTPase MeaB [Acidimicrobiales bacterium]
MKLTDRRSLAQAITLVESSRPEHRSEAVELLERVLPDTGGSVRVGITGQPGAGKSTFIEALGLHLVDAGHRVAVLAVDPSSTRSGGSILGDKTRMGELSRRDEAFIRPSPSGGTVGGVARRTREALLLCEAAGYDVVIVETVGSGQSDVAVADMVDVFVLLVPPAGGDELQGIKRGIMELADVLVVTKADGELAGAANRTASDHRHAVHLLHGAADPPPVVTASSVTGEGIDDAWSAIQAVHGGRDLSDLRSGQARSWLWDEVRETLLEELRTDPQIASLAPELEAQVTAGSMSPSAAARELLERFRGG